MSDSIFGLKQMKIKDWEKLFAKTAKNDERKLDTPREKCIFIDQTYCKSHKFLYEALYSNFSLFHQTIWTFACMLDGLPFEREALKSVATISERTKTRMGKNNQFYRMQLGDEYGDQTVVMNKMQKVLISNVNYFRNLDREDKPWQNDEFWDDTYRKKYEGDFIFYKNLDKNYNGIRAQIMRFFYPDNQKFIRDVMDEFIIMEWFQTGGTLLRH
jgi:hypothetical protein